MKTRQLPLLLVVAATSFLVACAKPAAEPVVGLQLWSLREETKKDPLRALDLVKGFGITQVETAGLAGMSVGDFRAALDARGLVARSAHVSYAAMLADLPAVVAEVKALGVTHAFCPWIPHKGAFNSGHVKTAAVDFNRFGAAFREAGIRFGYHNHGYEFAPGSKPGESLFDELAAQTDPALVAFQMDVLWVVHPGADPLALLEKYPGRWAAFHIKDKRSGLPPIVGSSSVPAADKVPIGKGQVDWEPLLRAARAQGMELFFLEDEGVAPLEEIPQSLAHLRGLKW